MIKVNTCTEKEYQTTNEVRDYSIKMDNSPANNGGDFGASPKEHLCAALGACTTMTLKMYINRKEWQVGKLKAETTFTTNEDKSTAFHINISIEGEFDEKQRKRLSAIAPKCPVHKLLSGNSNITVDWNYLG
jgi:putative redox protein